MTGWRVSSQETKAGAITVSITAEVPYPYSISFITQLCLPQYRGLHTSTLAPRALKSLGIILESGCCLLICIHKDYSNIPGLVSLVTSRIRLSEHFLLCMCLLLTVWNSACWSNLGPSLYHWATSPALALLRQSSLGSTDLPWIHYVTQVDLTFTSLCWDYHYSMPHHTWLGLLKKKKKSLIRQQWE